MKKFGVTLTPIKTDVYLLPYKAYTKMTEPMLIALYEEYIILGVREWIDKDNLILIRKGGLPNYE